MSGHHKWDDVRRSAPDQPPASPAETSSNLAETETAPAKRRPSDQRREPLAGSTPIMPAPPDLRQQLADTIRDQCPANPATLTGCRQCTAQHAAVMAVVQPELDAKDAEIDQLATQACPGCMARERERDAWTEVARQNGIKAQDYKQAAHRERQRAEAAEARLRALLDQHQFQQRAGVPVLVCTCGKWPSHHAHIGESTLTCGCDECRTHHQQIGDQT